jgi:hypothetical protein
MHIVNAIDEIHGGYNVDALINPSNNSDEQQGGSNSILRESSYSEATALPPMPDWALPLRESSIPDWTLPLSDLFIPFGLYYQNDRAEYTFYKPQKAGTVDDKLFDYLLDAVSKNRSKPTRKNIQSENLKKNKTHKHI